MNESKSPIPAREFVEDHYAATADELLDLLSPRHELWRDEPDAWIFEDTPTPSGSCARARCATHATRSRRRPIFTKADASIPSWSVLAGLQNRLLQVFGEALDRSGIAIPVQNPELDAISPPATESNAHPPRRLFPLMALAQHYGLPTMLLDWSRRSLVGAYFAAEEAADESKRGSATHVAVWALYRGGAHSLEGLLFFEAPASSNPNLRAQDGLFTLLPASEKDYRSVEDFFQRTSRIIGAPTRAPLRRIMMPIGETKELLRLLHYEGVNGASMFPGAYGVVRALREGALWDTAPRGK